MVAYSFQARFADAVATGRKRQTIRSQGMRRHARPGDKLQLYVGMRTNHCRKLVDPDPVCVSVQTVDIPENDFPLVDGKPISNDAAYMLAVNDGFSNVAEMLSWFKEHHGLPFLGVLIKWEPQG